MPSTQMDRKFKAAVNVIRGLPKNGSYQPSNDMMLRFYSFFKQATLGPCTQNKPPFWDVVGRAKFDSYKALGNMPKERAMELYVEELKKIIETMSYTDNVAEFLGSINELNGIDVDELEAVAPDAVKKARSHSNSPFASREASPIRLSNGNGYVNGQESIQNGHSSDQHSDDEYTDTVEDDIHLLREPIIHDRPWRPATRRPFNEIEPQVREITTTSASTSTNHNQIEPALNQILRTVESMRNDLQRINSRIDIVERSMTEVKNHQLRKKRKVEPILKEFGIDVQVLITQYAGQAREKMSAADLSEFDGIVTIGGDGILYEVVNGLRCRVDSKTVSNIPIGVIAGGSGNGLARSIAEYSGEAQEYLRNPVLLTTLAVVRGNVKKVNLAEIDLDGKTIYSFLSVGCGLLSDIDIESEVLRALGEPRFTIWSLLRIAKLRSYETKLSYIPFDDQVNENDENEMISSPSSDSVVMKEDFVCIYASIQSFIGTDLLFAPTANSNDGKIHLIYMLKDIGRMKATQFLTSIDKGTHLDVKGVKYITVKEFTIDQDGGIEGNPTIDGELVSGNRISVKLSPSPLNVFSL